MKKLLLCATILASTLSFAGELDGKSFCRTIESSGMFGQPAGKRAHCVSFENDKMTDNAPTHFGNPPSTHSYVYVAGKVLVVKDGDLMSPYKHTTHLEDDMSVTEYLNNSVGAILTLQ